MWFSLRFLPLLLCALLWGCAAGLPRQDSRTDEPATSAQAEGQPVELQPGIPWVGGEPALWHHKVFPGKRSSDYRLVQLDGRSAMHAQAASSASMLRQTLQVVPQDLNRLRFSWKVPALIETADLASRELDDSPVRVVLAFDGDRSRFSMKDAMLSQLSHALTGEPMPYATLMYVWSNQGEEGAVIHNPRTDRIRKIVLESGPGSLGQWRAYERDIRADFERAFGEAPGALTGIAIMTDSDNTRSVTQAWYGPVQLVARPPQN